MLYDGSIIFELSVYLWVWMMMIDADDALIGG
jgi:hypothetical protein